jgi:hypothetical protein
MGKSRSDFICLGCGEDTGKMHEFYMVHDWIWLSVMPSPHCGKLCIGCLERKLGRKLISSDFTNFPINYVSSWNPKSQRLMDRMKSH